MSAKAKMLVIGSTGQLGRSLKQQSQRDWPNFALETIGRSTIDLQNHGALAEFVANRNPDIVINAAAYTAVDRAESEPEIANLINAVAPGEIAKGAGQCGAVMVHVSTDYVFDGAKTGAYTEGDQTAPNSVYGKTKLLGEKAVLAGNPKSTIFRTAWVYSQFGNNFLKTMLRVGAERKELNVVDDQIGCPTSAVDLADAILHCANQILTKPKEEHFGVFHAAGRGKTSWFEFAQTIFDFAENSGFQKPDVLPIPTSQYPTAAKRPANSVLSTDKLNRVFGYELPCWKDSTERTVAGLLAGANGNSPTSIR